VEGSTGMNKADTRQHLFELLAKADDALTGYSMDDLAMHPRECQVMATHAALEARAADHEYQGKLIEWEADGEGLYVNHGGCEGE